jgi:hypothetical protein
VILPESPKGLAFDGSLTAWAVYVFTNAVPEMVALGTLILVVLRIMILWRQWRRG